MLYGFTKGQFSIIDLITACLEHTGPAALDISTWTAANTDVTVVCDFVSSGALTASRWLVDLTFQRRSPALAERIRRTFGLDSIRVAKNHAKFSLLYNDRWSVVIQTSMNLNFNPRFENFSICHEPDLCGFHRRIFNEVWKRQPRHVAGDTPYKIEKYFADTM